MALTPGGVDQDLERLNYKRIKRPMFPLDKDMKNVNLKTRFIMAADELQKICYTINKNQKEFEKQPYLTNPLRYSVA